MYTPYDGKFRISNPYNKPNHNGMDMVGYTSKKIYAVAGGVVEVADDKGALDPNGFGCYVRIAVSGKAKTYDYYGHMVKGSLAVKVGEIVKQGQIIGTEGNTGQSTGNHLHFERRVGGYGRECAVNVAEVLGIENKEGIYITDNSKNKPSTSTAEKTLVKQAQHTITATKTVDEDKLLAETTKLKTLGYSVSSKMISAAVYEIKVATHKKSVNDIAIEVVKGLWGNGEERKKRLTEAGYDYSAVQAQVNRLV